METIASILTDSEWSPYAAGIGIGILSWLSFFDIRQAACHLYHLCTRRGDD
jgi:hypothetical protein